MADNICFLLIFFQLKNVYFMPVLLQVKLFLNFNTEYTDGVARMFECVCDSFVCKSERDIVSSLLHSIVSTHIHSNNQKSHCSKLLICLICDIFYLNCSVEIMKFWVKISMQKYDIFRFSFKFTFSFFYIFFIKKKTLI